MHREDNSKYLLYIEPTKKERLNEPIDDELTVLIEKAIEKSTSGTAGYSTLEDEGSFTEGSGYRGFHMTECKESSTNKDYLLENGMITNSLAPFYLRWYRNSIPESELMKVLALKNYYK